MRTTSIIFVAHLVAILAVPASIADSQNDQASRTLVYAAGGGDKDTCESALQNGADVNFINDWRNSAVTAAVEGGHENVVKFLVENGADINRRDFQGFDYERRPLQLAIKKGHTTIVKYLIQHGVDFSCGGYYFYYCPLILAINNGHVDIVKYLVQNGTDPNQSDSRNERNALSVAIQTSNIDIVRALIDGGANVRTKLSGDVTMLMKAIVMGREDIIRLLVERGADINEHATFGTPLELAILQDKLNIVKLLLELGADINLVSGDSNYSETPLSRAIDHGNVAIIKLLIQHNVDLNKGFNGARLTTPLMYAIYSGKEEIVEILLQNGANAAATDSNGNTVDSFIDLLDKEEQKDDMRDLFTMYSSKYQENNKIVPNAHKGICASVLLNASDDASALRNALQAKVPQINLSEYQIFYYSFESLKNSDRVIPGYFIIRSAFIRVYVKIRTVPKRIKITDFSQVTLCKSPEETTPIAEKELQTGASTETNGVNDNSTGSTEPSTNQ